jgi:hypothetical protein
VQKAIRSQSIDRNLQERPFILQLIDLYGQKTFVDEQRNKTVVVDLEWSCSLPIEMQQLLHWLSGHEGYDSLGDEAAENEGAFTRA